MKYQKNDNGYQLTVKNAITWFDELVRINGVQCSTSTFIHNSLIGMLEGTYSDGVMIWDKDCFERAYPAVTEQIKSEEREKILGIIKYQVPDFINRRLKDGK